LGMKPADYDGVRLWIAPGKDRRSLAQISDTLLLIGWRETLEAAIDRNCTFRKNLTASYRPEQLPDEAA